MTTFTKVAATTSAVALAAATVLGGAGIAGAQSAMQLGSSGEAGTGEPTSGGSSEIVADLDTAATALNGPVKVSGNAEGGPDVTYTNENEVDQKCVGFTMPYSTVAEAGIDPSGLDLSDLGAAMTLIAGIEAAGGVSVLVADATGAPSAHASAPGADVITAAIGLLGGGGVVVPAGESVTWTATSPDTPAAGVTMCAPDPEGGLLDVSFGIDPQVVADQINDKLGPLGSLDAGSVSGGSVSGAAGSLGSVAGVGNDAPEDPAPAA